jgi:hypothetical protein
MGSLWNLYVKLDAPKTSPTIVKPQKIVKPIIISKKKTNPIISTINKTVKLGKRGFTSIRFKSQKK